MIGKLQFYLLLVGVIGIVQSLSSKRVAYKIRPENYQELDAHSKDDRFHAFNNIEKEDPETYDGSIKSKASIDNLIFKYFNTRLDELFKQYEDKTLNKVYSIIKQTSDVNKYNDQNNKDIDNTEDNHNVASRIGHNEGNILANTKRDTYRNINLYGKYNLKDNKKYDKFDKLFEEVSNAENNENNFEESENVEEDFNNEDNYLYRDSNNNEDEDISEYVNLNEVVEEDKNEYDDNPAPFDRNNEDRKDEEFGVFDYLAASKDSDEDDKDLFNVVGEVEKDGEFVPDDYFDNSDYEA